MSTFISEFSASTMRRPAFMAAVGAEPTVQPAFFGAELREATREAGRLRTMPMPAPMNEGPELPEEILLPHGTSPAAPPAPVFVPPVLVPPPPPTLDTSRLEAAVDRLRMLSDRLTAEVRADAVEVAMMLARKIVESEITANPDRLLSQVRSAVRRLGESRRISVRLCPEDAEAVNTATNRNSSELGGGVARVEIVADATLSRGDCVVDGELGSVDGRLDTRLHELRRALTDPAVEEHA